MRKATAFILGVALAIALPVLAQVGGVPSFLNPRALSVSGSGDTTQRVPNAELSALTGSSYGYLNISSQSSPVLNLHNEATDTDYGFIHFDDPSLILCEFDVEGTALVSCPIEFYGPNDGDNLVLGGQSLGTPVSTIVIQTPIDLQDAGPNPRIFSSTSNVQIDDTLDVTGPISDSGGNLQLSDAVDISGIVTLTSGSGTITTSSGELNPRAANGVFNFADDGAGTSVTFNSEGGLFNFTSDSVQFTNNSTYDLLIGSAAAALYSPIYDEITIGDGDDTVTIDGNVDVTGTITGTLTGSGAIHTCYVDSSAAAEVCSDSITVSFSSPTYTVTHNFGLTAFSDMVVNITPIDSVGTSAKPVVTSPGTNSFGYRVNSDGGDVASAVFIVMVEQ